MDTLDGFSDAQRQCLTMLNLSEDELERLKKLMFSLPYIANLVCADVFIDCFFKEDSQAIVLAWAKPDGDFSNYDHSVVGQRAEVENEPAVFAVRATGLPVRDLRATTQENKQVRQDVAPIKNSFGEVYGVLIREKDVSEIIRRDRKYDELIQLVSTLSVQAHKTVDLVNSPENPDALSVKEMHHRIKNNLQTIASILNMQARRSSLPEVRAAFKENVNRVLGFAAIHEIMTQNEDQNSLPLLELLEKLRRNTVIYSNTEEKSIDITISGDNFMMPADKASSIALVVNELLSNAIEHAFVGRSEGHITIDVKKGLEFSSVTVTDDGIGFKPEENSAGNRLGLAIVRNTVTEKLGGKIQFFSTGDGTSVRVTFKP